MLGYEKILLLSRAKFRGDYHFGYQFQKLEERDFELTTTRPGVTNPYEVVTADGDVHVFSGAVTVKF